MGGAMAASSSRRRSFLFLFSISFLASCLAAPTEILYRVPEEQPPNRLLGSLALDQGLPDSGHQYKLEIGAPYLRVDEKTGDIYSTDFPIDRETLGDCRDLLMDEKCFLEFQVSVTDAGSGAQSLEGRIEVLDINDNTPQFPSPVLTLSIPENTLVGTLFSIPMATDKDARVNGVERYWLSSRDDSEQLFSLQVATDSGQKVPQLVVMGNLDREAKDSYDFNIRVVDGGTPERQSSSLLRVIITNQNGNTLRFEKSHYEAELLENSPQGLSVTQVRATEGDSRVNAEIDYSFQKASVTVQQLLRINRSTGVISVKGYVDREEQNFLKFFVVARDRGSNFMSSEVLVNVTIRDQNDNVPSIEIRGIGLIRHHNGVTRVPEDVPIGTPVGQVRVSDRDEGENAMVTCVVLGDVPFQLQLVNNSADERTRTYILQTTTLLDFERVKDYRIEIMAKDSGNPAHSTLLSLKVDVIDINDNAPFFSPTVFEVDFAEENMPGDKVLDVFAEDADSYPNAELVYSVVEETARQVFEIDSASGEVRARSVLDREEIDRYEFRVTATDKGVHSKTATATVIINVLDRNDNDPQFMLRSYSFSVLENMPPLSPVGVVTVTDADKGENSRVKLFVEPDNGKFFIHDGTGTILSSISFDREKESTYTFRLKAVDFGEWPRTSYAAVTINILDENDNAPRVTKPSNSSYKYFPLLTPPETTIEVVQAEDIDLGFNSDLVYKLMGGNPHGLFRISTTKGEITLAREFTYKHRGLHRLVVKVSDMGEPQRHTTALVHVFVNDTKSDVSQIEALVRHSVHTPLDRDIAGEPNHIPAQRSHILYWSLAGVAGVILVIIAIVMIYHHLQKDSKSGYQASSKESKELYAPTQDPNNSKGESAENPPKH